MHRMRAGLSWRREWRPCVKQDFTPDPSDLTEGVKILKSGNRYIIGLDHGNHLIKTVNHIMQNEVKRLGANIKNDSRKVISQIGGSIPGDFGSCSLTGEPGKITNEMASFLSGLNSSE